MSMGQSRGHKHSAAGDPVFLGERTAEPTSAPTATKCHAGPLTWRLHPQRELEDTMGRCSHVSFRTPRPPRTLLLDLAYKQCSHLREMQVLVVRARPSSHSERARGPPSA